MPRQKLNRYARISADPRVVHWYNNLQELFIEERKHYKRVVLEIACWRWEYSVWLASHFPETLFVGIDVKGDRIWVWLDHVRKQWLENVRFICGIVHHLQSWLPPESVDEIWIVHPDPRPKWRDEKRRLTYPRFLEMYAKILKKKWLVRLQTDDQDLFQYSLQEIEKYSIKYGVDWNGIWKLIVETTDLHANENLLADHYGIQTHYEKEAIKEWKTICYGVWEKK